MSSPPAPTPEELKRQRRLKEEIAEARYQHNKKARIWTGAGIGFFLSLLMNSGFLIFSDRWIMVTFLVFLGTTWSLLVQFKNINHLISAAVYGISAMILLFVVYDPFPPLFWCLAVVINGALIGVVNDIYRTKFMGI
jgi:hypothetical protein